MAETTVDVIDTFFDDVLPEETGPLAILRVSPSGKDYLLHAGKNLIVRRLSSEINDPDPLRKSRQIPLGDPSVSSLHAEVQIHETDPGRFSGFVCDLGSRNKTRLDSTTIGVDFGVALTQKRGKTIILESNHSYELKEGMSLYFGNLRTLFMLLPRGTQPSSGAVDGVRTCDIPAVAPSCESTQTTSCALPDVKRGSSTQPSQAQPPPPQPPPLPVTPGSSESVAAVAANHSAPAISTPPPRALGPAQVALTTVSPPHSLSPLQPCPAPTAAAIVPPQSPAGSLIADATNANTSCVSAPCTGIPPRTPGTGDTARPLMPVPPRLTPKGEDDDLLALMLQDSPSGASAVADELLAGAAPSHHRPVAPTSQPQPTLPRALPLLADVRAGTAGSPGLSPIAAPILPPPSISLPRPPTLRRAGTTSPRGDSLATRDGGASPTKGLSTVAADSAAPTLPSSPTAPASPGLLASPRRAPASPSLTPTLPTSPMQRPSCGAIAGEGAVDVVPLPSTAGKIRGSATPPTSPSSNKATGAGAASLSCSPTVPAASSCAPTLVDDDAAVHGSSGRLTPTRLPPSANDDAAPAPLLSAGAPEPPAVSRSPGAVAPTLPSSPPPPPPLSSQALLAARCRPSLLAIRAQAKLDSLGDVAPTVPVVDMPVAAALESCDSAAPGAPAAPGPREESPPSQGSGSGASQCSPGSQGDATSSPASAGSHSLTRLRSIDLMPPPPPGRHVLHALHAAVAAAGWSPPRLDTPTNAQAMVAPQSPPGVKILATRGHSSAELQLKRLPNSAARLGAADGCKDTGRSVAGSEVNSDDDSGGDTEPEDGGETAGAAGEQSGPTGVPAGPSGRGHSQTTAGCGEDSSGGDNTSDGDTEPDDDGDNEDAGSAAAAASPRSTPSAQPPQCAAAATPTKVPQGACFFDPDATVPDPGLSDEGKTPPIEAPGAGGEYTRIGSGPNQGVGTECSALFSPTLLDEPLPPPPPRARSPGCSDGGAHGPSASDYEPTLLEDAAHDAEALSAANEMAMYARAGGTGAAEAPASLTKPADQTPLAGGALREGGDCTDEGAAQLDASGRSSSGSGSSAPVPAGEGPTQLDTASPTSCLFSRSDSDTARGASESATESTSGSKGAGSIWNGECGPTDVAGSSQRGALLASASGTSAGEISTADASRANDSLYAPRPQPQPPQPALPMPCNQCTLPDEPVVAAACTAREAGTVAIARPEASAASAAVAVAVTSTTHAGACEATLLDEPVAPVVAGCAAFDFAATLLDGLSTDVAAATTLVASPPHRAAVCEATLLDEPALLDSTTPIAASATATAGGAHASSSGTSGVMAAPSTPTGAVCKAASLLSSVPLVASGHSDVGADVRSGEGTPPHAPSKVATAASTATSVATGSSLAMPPSERTGRANDTAVGARQDPSGVATGGAAGTSTREDLSDSAEASSSSTTEAIPRRRRGAAALARGRNRPTRAVTSPHASSSPPPPSSSPLERPACRATRPTAFTSPAVAVKDDGGRNGRSPRCSGFRAAQQPRKQSVPRRRAAAPRTARRCQAGRSPPTPSNADEGSSEDKPAPSAPLPSPTQRSPSPSSARPVKVPPAVPPLAHGSADVVEPTPTSPPPTAVQSTSAVASLSQPLSPPLSFPPPLLSPPPLPPLRPTPSSPPMRSAAARPEPAVPASPKLAAAPSKPVAAPPKSAAAPASPPSTAATARPRSAEAGSRSSSRGLAADDSSAETQDPASDDSTPSSAPHASAPPLPAHVTPAPAAKRRGAHRALGHGRKRSRSQSTRGSRVLPATAPGGRGSQEVAVASGSVVRAAPTARETGSEDSIEGVDSGADNGKIDQLPPLRFISDNGGPADDAPPVDDCSHPIVLFTGLVRPPTDKVAALGGRTTKDPGCCTCVVTDRIRRTVNFLAALCRGVPIVRPRWVDESRTHHRFLELNRFVLVDPEGERQHSFVLADCLRRARAAPALAGVDVLVTPRVEPPPAELAKIVRCAGGRLLSTAPPPPPRLPSAVPAGTSSRRGGTVVEGECHLVVISCPEDAMICADLLRRGVTARVHTTEFLYRVALTQRCDLAGTEHILWATPDEAAAASTAGASQPHEGAAFVVAASVRAQPKRARAAREAGARMASGRGWRTRKAATGRAAGLGRIFAEGNAGEKVASGADEDSEGDETASSESSTSSSASSSASSDSSSSDEGGAKDAGDDESGSDEGECKKRGAHKEGEAPPGVAQAKEALGAIRLAARGRRRRAR